jgi:carbamate kinase
MKPLILIALGGNALIQKGQKGTAEEQFANLKVPMRQIARLSRNYRIVITHGNGPQAGNLLLQQESCTEVPNMPLEIIVAMTQGQIGYMIESTLDRALMEIGVTTEQLFVSLISYVVVDEKDPAFQNPTKPIGPFYTEQQVKHKNVIFIGAVGKGFHNFNIYYRDNTAYHVAAQHRMPRYLVDAMDIPSESWKR